MTEDVGSPSFTTVDALRPDSTGHNLVVKVLDEKTVIERSARPGGKSQKITECLVGDATGTILFSARNEQADSFKPGTYLTLRNARIEMIRGNMRLAINQFGKIEVSDGANFTPRTENNLSLVEYELVPLPAEKTAAEEAEAESAEEIPVEVAEEAS